MPEFEFFCQQPKIYHFIVGQSLFVVTEDI